MPEDRPKSAFLAFTEAVVASVDGPVTWFRGKVQLFFLQKVVIQHFSHPTN